MTDMITFNVTLADLLGLTVGVDWHDERQVTMAELIAREIAERFTVTTTIRDEIRQEVQRQVADLVRGKLAGPPDSKDSLSGMILAEAKAQLTPDPARYYGSSTPMSQYVAAEVYKTIREQAVPVVQRVQQEVDKAVDRAVRDQLGTLLRRAALDAEDDGT